MAMLAVMNDGHPDRWYRDNIVAKFPGRNLIMIFDEEDQLIHPGSNNEPNQPLVQTQQESNSTPRQEASIPPTPPNRLSPSHNAHPPNSVSSYPSSATVPPQKNPSLKSPKKSTKHSNQPKKKKNAPVAN